MFGFRAEVRIPLQLNSPDELRLVAKKAGEAALKHYHRYYLHYHFKPVNASRYRHTPRNPIYEIKKRRYGASRGIPVCDMVLTGRMKTAMMGKTPDINHAGSNQHNAKSQMSYDIPHEVTDRILDELAEKTPDELDKMQQVIEQIILDYYTEGKIP